MTHTPRIENAMKATMTANDTLGTCGPEGAKELHNAPRAGHSLRCSAQPGQRSSRSGPGPAARLPHSLLRNAAALVALASLMLGTMAPAQAQTTVPGEPQNLVARGGDARVRLTWTASADMSSARSSRWCCATSSFVAWTTLA